MGAGIAIKPLALRVIEDWQPVDVVWEEIDDLQGVWIHGQFVELDRFVSYDTPWTGKAPNCVDEQGNKVVVHGVSMDQYFPYFIEISDERQEIRIWGEIVK